VAFGFPTASIGLSYSKRRLFPQQALGNATASVGASLERQLFFEP
jgi:hypothetical protein